MWKKFIIIIGLIFIVLLFSGCIGNTPEEAINSKISEKTFISETLGDWKADGVIGKDEYSHKISLNGGKFIAYWGNDDEYIYMGLRGQSIGWVAIGFEPTNAMKDADMVFGWVKDGHVVVLDLYSTGTFGPHPLDESLGGTNDILEYGGIEENGYTTLEFKRKLDTKDKYDKAFVRGQKIRFIWAMADSDDLNVKHNIAKGNGELTLD
ncbi:MAG: hypothetical protein PWP15_584 [Methanothermococcus sp.]|jgi:hypothetical protein|uniref:DOMON domain-containing protein n=1 Tax=Methanothermococcus TaxID=155862 RepID=UPI00037FB661|nr:MULTISPECIES: DOMON domain-containing protein [Methanothermococcus]MDK2790077.1 hypothetical protein [Methanothermococcus sp.]